MWNNLTQGPVRFEKGYVIASDGPGHGIEFGREWLAHYA